VVAITLIGISNSAFGSLGAVFAQRLQLDIATIATFMSITILAGALVQIPIGYLSDRFNRRIILVVLATGAAFIDLFFLRITNPSTTSILIAGAVFGGAIYSLPPVVMAHANDHADKNRYLQTSGGMLLLFGAGSILGPLFAGLIMLTSDTKGLFIVTLWAHLTIIIYVMKTRVNSHALNRVAWCYNQTRFQSPVLVWKTIANATCHICQNEFWTRLINLYQSTKRQKFIRTAQATTLTAVGSKRFYLTTMRCKNPTSRF